VASLAHISEKNNLINLAVGLILLLLIGALMEHFPGDAGPRIVQAATVAILLVNTWGMKGTKSRLAVNIFFVLVVLLLVVGGAMLDHAGFSKAHMFLMLCFFIWLTWLVAHQVLFTGKIDTNKIIGAICIYMLLGLIWAMLYLFIAEAVPGAFNGMTQAPWLDNFATAVYFSFVTITTLGYGDVSPVLPLARFLVYMEAIVGVFYMAILVASLIGVRLSDRDVVRR
jgi:voltage-gated potassium channel